MKFTKWLIDHPYAVQVFCLGVGLMILADKAFRPPHSGPEWFAAIAGGFDVIVGTWGIFRVRRSMRRLRALQTFLGHIKEM